jgi:hypothetical protein
VAHLRELMLQELQRLNVGLSDHDLFSFRAACSGAIWSQTVKPRGGPSVSLFLMRLRRSRASDPIRR